MRPMCSHNNHFAEAAFFALCDPDVIRFITITKMHANTKRYMKAVQTCCEKKYATNNSQLPCLRNFLISLMYLLREAMSRRSISVIVRFVFWYVMPMSLNNLHKVVFVKFGKLSSLEAFRALFTVRISILAYKLGAFEGMACKWKLSYMRVFELEIFTSFFFLRRHQRLTPAFRLQFLDGTGRYSGVLSRNNLFSSQTDISGKRIVYTL